MVDYTCTDMLEGNVYATRNAEVARLEGSWTVKTHYVPELAYSSWTMRAVYEALQTMHRGDSVVLYAHSALTFGNSQSSYSGGYQGAADHVFPGNIPSIIYLKLTEVFDDPIARENALVEQYAVNELQLAAADTLATDIHPSHQYLKIVTARPDSAVIADNSTVSIYYITSFLDGFVADTNIDSVARRVWNASPSPALTYAVSSSSTSVIKGLYNALINMRYGEWGRTVFTSDYGYGYDGKTGTPVIQPYEPLVMDIYPLRGE